LAEVPYVAEKTKPCIVACSSLKEEIQKLIKQGELDADAVFVSKFFHVDYALIEQNLRPIIQKNLQRYPKGIILVYGDLCLGPNGEMKQLAADYGIAKVDALNCTDCLMGGKGKIAEVDPNHELMVLHPGMNGFFSRVKETARQEGMDEEALKNLFTGLKGIVFLDSLGNGAEKSRAALKELDMGLPLLETKAIGLEKLKQVLLKAMEQNRRHRQPS
jgi:hypothetical protein